MVRSKLKILSSGKSKPLVTENEILDKDMGIENFFKFHAKFIEFKVLEGLASRTIEDHEKFMKYFKNYIFSDQRSIENRWLNIDVFRGYLYFMVHEKKLKPCTVNLRLRTLKCYLRWLYNEDYLDIDYSTKLKLVKVPEDLVKHLPDEQIKLMLKTPNREIYSGYRDFVLMVLMLDCGISINEALTLENEDIDTKSNLITIKSENAKSRKSRQVPISPKTCKLLKELLQISKENNCDYVFQSSFGGKIETLAIIKNFEKY